MKAFTHVFDNSAIFQSGTEEPVAAISAELRACKGDSPRATYTGPSATVSAASCAEDLDSPVRDDNGKDDTGGQQRCL